MIHKNLIIIITFSLFIFSFFFNNVFAVEPSEILKDIKQEKRARKVSKNISMYNQYMVSWIYCECESVTGVTLGVHSTLL